MPVPRKFADWVLLLACNFIWASQFVLVKLVADRVGPIFATAAPMLVATVMLAPLALPGLLRRARLGGGDLGRFIALGVFGQVVAQLFVTWGVRSSLASNAALLTLTLPVVTAVIAFVVLRERMTATRWVGFGLALVGTVACSASDMRGLSLGGSYFAGNTLIFLGVTGSAFYNVYSKKLLQRYTALEVLFCSYVAVCAVLLPLTLALEPEVFPRLAHLPWATWLGLGLLAVFQYGLSMIIFLTVLTRLDATQAALSNYLIPVFGLVMAWAILGETLTAWSMAGGALVLASTWVVTVFEGRRARIGSGAPAATLDPQGMV